MYSYLLVSDEISYLKGRVGFVGRSGFNKAMDFNSYLNTGSYSGRIVF